MRLVGLGVGGAGCRLADALTAHPDAERFLLETVAFDTDASALEDLTSIDDANRHRFGSETDGLDGDLHAGFDMAADVVPDVVDVVLDADAFDGETEETGVSTPKLANPENPDAILVLVGFGGATGGGVVSPLVSDLKARTSIPVFVAGTLPASTERSGIAADASRSGFGQDDGSGFRQDGGTGPGTDSSSGYGKNEESGSKTTSGGELVDRPLAEPNAGRVLDRLHGVPDALFPFDNDGWLRSTETLGTARSRLNNEFTRRLGAVFSSPAAHTDGLRVEQQVDAVDLRRAIGDDAATVAIGRASQTVAESDDRMLESVLGGVIDRLLGNDDPAVDTSKAVSAVETVIRKSVRGKRTIDGVDATRGLLVLGGNPAWLDRQAISTGHSWLQSELDSDTVWGGVDPRPGSDSVSAVTLLAGSDPPRIRDLRDLS